MVKQRDMMLPSTEVTLVRGMISNMDCHLERWLSLTFFNCKFTFVKLDSPTETSSILIWNEALLKAVHSKNWREISCLTWHTYQWLSSFPPEHHSNDEWAKQEREMNHQQTEDFNRLSEDKVKKRHVSDLEWTKITLQCLLKGALMRNKPTCCTETNKVSELGCTKVWI